jgi:hypothetical protein
VERFSFFETVWVDAKIPPLIGTPSSTPPMPTRLSQSSDRKGLRWILPGLVLVTGALLWVAYVFMRPAPAKEIDGGHAQRRESGSDLPKPDSVRRNDEATVAKFAEAFSRLVTLNVALHKRSAEMNALYPLRSRGLAFRNSGVLPYLKGKPPEFTLKMRHDREAMESWLKAHPEKAVFAGKLRELTELMAVRDAAAGTNPMGEDLTVILRDVLNDPKRLSSLRALIARVEKDYTAADIRRPLNSSASPEEVLAHIDANREWYDKLWSDLFEKTGFPEDIRETVFLDNTVESIHPLLNHYAESHSGDIHGIEGEIREQFAQLRKLAKDPDTSEDAKTRVLSILAGPKNEVAANTDADALPASEMAQLNAIVVKVVSESMNSEKK